MSADLVEASGRVLDAVVAQMGGSPREGQASMVAEGAAALEDRQHLLVQAGTGTGKSVGYLVPLLTHCATNGVRGVVSTATLALQRQILVKDAPVVVDAVASQTGARLKVAVLKGWSNYACLHKLDGGYPTEGTLFEDRDVSVGPTGELGKEILRIREWISETTTGDRDDLVPGVSDRAWHHASVAKPECLGKHCPLIDECFAQAARMEAADADVVVTNHSLFGINACGEGELFGEYDAVVIDEAHELADRVRSQAAADLTVARVSRVARSLRSNLSIDSTDLDEAGAGLGAAMAPLEAGLLEYRPSALVDAMIVLDGAARRASHEVSEAQGEPAAKLLARAAIDELIGALDAWGRDPDQSIAYITKDESDNARLTVGPSMYRRRSVEPASVNDRRSSPPRPSRSVETSTSWPPRLAWLSPGCRGTVSTWVPPLTTVDRESAMWQPICLCRGETAPPRSCSTSSWNWRRPRAAGCSPSSRHDAGR